MGAYGLVLTPVAPDATSIHLPIGQLMCTRYKLSRVKDSLKRLYVA